MHPSLDFEAANAGLLHPASAADEPSEPPSEPLAPPVEPAVIPLPPSPPTELELADEDPAHLARRAAALAAALAAQSWAESIPARSASAPPHPLWLTPEMDAHHVLRPGGASLARMPPDADSEPCDPPPPRKHFGHRLADANAGDELVVMRRPASLPVPPLPSHLRSSAQEGSTWSAARPATGGGLSRSGTAAAASSEEQIERVTAKPLPKAVAGGYDTLAGSIARRVGVYAAVARSGWRGELP